MLQKKIGFIGAGQAARALARGFVAAKLVRPEKVFTSDPSVAATKDFCEAVSGAIVEKSNSALVQAADVVFLAVKPQDIQGVLSELHLIPKADKLFVSIAAGVHLSTLAVGLATERLVRVMPNTPCLISQSAAGYCLAPGATQEDGRLVSKLFHAVGIAFELEEKLLDAVTGLSGSGPAFVYVIIEALSDGGVKMGLPRQVASALAAQTLRGAAEMMLTTGQHPAVLKDQVVSPGGTTIAGLGALEQGGLRSILIAAVEAATRRSMELGAVEE